MTTGDRNAPSARTLRLLGALLPHDLREAVIGDLLEEHRAPGGFWLHAIRSTLVLLPRRIRELAGRSLSAGKSMTGFTADLQAAARTLRRAPLFAAAASLTLAVAIGTVVAIYGVTAPVVLRPLPYADPERVVVVSEQDADGRASNVGYETWLDFAARSRTVERSAVRGSWLPVLSDAHTAERVSGLRVSWQYFATLGVHPALGRDFIAADDTPETRDEVILSHGLWTRRFGADRAIVGRSVDVGGTAMTVIGVMPAGFEDALAPEAQVWRALGYSVTQPWACRTCRHLKIIARLRPGVARDDAARELAAISATIVAEHPRDYARAGALLTRLQDAAAGEARAPLLALLAATALLLLIAIANVAGLQLARAVRREGEFAVRVALGAGRGRLARQLLAEGLVLATIAGALGAALAAIAMPMLVARMPQALAGLSRARLDGRALLLTVLVSLVAALLVGVAPVWRIERRVAAGAWRAGARIAGGARLARAGIVVVEVAVATVLLAATGLVGRSLVTLLAVDPGFRAERLLTVEYQLSGRRYDSASKVFAQHRRVVDAVAAIPGVAAAGVVSQLPLGGNLDAYGVIAEDRPLANPELAPMGDRYVVTHGFMQAMGIGLVRGRAFTASDERPTDAPVVLVSAALARRIWGAEDPIGRRVQVGGPEAPWRTVVGVTRDVRHSGLDDDEPQQLYVPMGQWGFADDEVTLAVRTTVDPASVAGTVRRTLAALDPMVPLGRVATMEQVVATSTAQRRLALQLLAAFGAVALLLTVAGLYALLAGTVAERRRELGVRSALGATPRALLALVLGDGARLTMLGLAIGLAVAAVGTRALRSLLFGVAPGDPATLAGIALLLGGIALVACLVPATRALRVAPTEALRGE